MGWQISSALARVARVVPWRRRWASNAAITRSRALSARRSKGAATAVERAYERAAARLTDTDRFALAKAISSLDDAARATVERGLAARAPVAAVVALARSWAALGSMERALAADPVGRRDAGPVTWGGVRARQIDGTTCGAASVAMMTMMGDPFVGLWLASGATLEGYLPSEIAAVPERNRLATIEERWGAIQRTTHARLVRRGLGLFPWPRMFGTPPWRIDNGARFLGMRFRGVIADDTHSADTEALLSHAAAAVDDGIPVPVYASGDSSLGLDAVIPRHVILLVARDGDAFLAYEPSSAALHRVTDHQLAQGGERLAALGNWSHLSWIVLPRARRQTQQLALDV